MGGAYVAKPDAEVVPDVPPGWNNWPFPGTFPPGYVPDYSYTLAAPAAIIPTGSAEATATLYDHETYKTLEPATEITWTAAIGGVTIPLKLSAGAEYAASIDTDYSDVGSGFWGAVPTFYFQLDDSAIGSTLVLTATDTISGIDIAKTANILVVLPVLTVTLTSTYIPPGGDTNAIHAIILAADNGASITEGGWAQVYQHWIAQPSMWHGSSSVGDVEVTNPYGGDGISLIEAVLIDSIYRIKVYTSTYPSASTVTYVLTVKLGGAELGEYTKEIEYTIGLSGPGQGEVYVWLTIDGSTGEVTLVNEFTGEHAQFPYPF